MASATIQLPWGGVRREGGTPHTLIEAGTNYQVYTRTTGTPFALAWNGEKTVYKLFKNQSTADAITWAVQQAGATTTETPEEPVEEKTGFLEIRSNPDGATIFIELEELGEKTPARIEVPAGLTLVTVQLEGYRPTADTITAVAGATRTKNFTLTKIEEEPEPIAEPTTIEQVPRQARSILEATSLWLTGDVPDWLNKWENLLDWLTDTFGTEIPQHELDKVTGKFVPKTGGKKIIFFFNMQAPVTGLQKAAAGAVAKGTAEAIIGQARGQPAQLADEFAKLLPAQKSAVHTSLQLAGAIGKSASDSIFRVTGPALEKAGIKSLTKTLPAIWKPIAFVGGIVALKEAVSWFHKELPEIIGFPLRDLIRDKKWERAAVLLPAYEKLVNTATTFFRATGFETLIGLPLWQGYADAYDAQVANWKQEIAEGLAAGQPETTISVSTNVDPALASITTVFLEKVTPFTSGIAPGRYDLTVEKEGYMPRTVTTIVKENQNNPVTIELQPIPSEIAPRAGRLEVAVFNKQTGTPLLASFFINDRLEKATAHAITLDVVPGPYEIRVEAASYKVFNDTVQVDEGTTTKIRADMEKPEVPLPEIPEPKPPVGEAPEIVAQKGRLEITANTPASILLGGVEQDKKTPASFDLTQGIYTITLKADGFRTRATTSLVKAGEVSRVSLELQPEEAAAPTTRLAQLNVNSSPTGAKILVNGEWTKQYTPDSVLLLPGEYELSLTKSGFKPWTTPLRLTEE